MGKKDSSNDKNVQKKRPKAPPLEASLSFDQILKLAAVKQHEPIKIEKKLEPTTDKKESEPERLMTKKEKQELMRRKEEERDRQLRKEGKLPPITPTPSQPLPNAVKEKTSSKTVSTKDTQKAPITLNDRSAKPSSNQMMANKPVGRPDVPKVMNAKSVDNQRPGASKGIPNKSGLSGMKSLPAKQPQSSQLRKNLPPGKGKSLAPVSTSRPFPPYRDIRPSERAYKSTT